jgi:hypothetical protein
VLQRMLTALSVNAACPRFGRYWGNSGQRLILARDGLSANDPTATWPAISTSTAAGTAGRHPHLPFGLPGNPENRYHPSQFGVHPGNAGLCMEKYEKSRHQTTEECVIQSD